MPKHVRAAARLAPPPMIIGGQCFFTKGCFTFCAIIED